MINISFLSAELTFTAVWLLTRFLIWKRQGQITLILDDGDCFVGDLEPFEYLEAYTENTQLMRDWEHIRSFGPKRIFYAHRPEKKLD